MTPLFYMREYPKELIQSMPVPLLAQWRNETPSPNDDLALMESIMADGFLEPVEIGVGIWSRKVRLNTGNHKIYLAPRMGITQLPVIARVWNYCSFDNHNGDHSYDCRDITVSREWIAEEYFAKPSDVLDVMALMTNMKF